MASPMASLQPAQGAGLSSSPFTALAPPLSKATLDVVHEVLGFTHTTPVQEAAIPLLLGYKDVSVDACTGSGKTLAFVIPIVEKIRALSLPKKKSHHVVALVLSPTRELASQIYTVLEAFNAGSFTSALLVGGSSTDTDVQAIRERGCQVIIGTPGRVDDIFTRLADVPHALDLKSSFEMLVLDEADRLLDMGFQRQVDAIMKRVPRQRRTGLFSATQTDAVKSLARAGLRNPVRVQVRVDEVRGDGAQGGNNILPTTLEVRYKVVEQRDKLGALVRFLEEREEERQREAEAVANGGAAKTARGSGGQDGPGRPTAKNNKGIVYFLTCACVDYFGVAMEALKEAFGIRVPVYVLHGRMKQKAREGALGAFAEAEEGILLATDVAARGLDIPDVEWVLQYDAPQDPNAFVHRCGRTARMGRQGRAMVFLTPEEDSYVRFLELRRVPMKEEGEDAQGDGEAAQKALDVLRNLSETDRVAMEYGTRAFVSYLRAYKEHVCKYIFQFSELEMGWLASSLGALRLPKMKEIKKAARLLKQGKLEGFVESSVDIDAIPFKDPKREKQRLVGQEKKKQERAEQVAAARGGRNGDNGDVRDVRKGHKDDKDNNDARNPKHSNDKNQNNQSTVRLTASKRRTLESRQELADLEDDYALWKKLKKGKITQAEYDAAMELDDDDDGLVEAALQKKKKRGRRRGMEGKKKASS